jgi:uncharacterized protein
MILSGSRVLITGASAGIGHEFARQLAPVAKQLILVARREERLESLANELRTKHPSLEINNQVIDLSDRSQLRSLTRSLESSEVQIDLLINNAGLGDLGRFATGDAEKLDQIVQVNIHALTLLTRAALPQMIARKRGAVLNVSSCAGFLPIPEFAVYAASKAYVTSFTEALRAELCGTGVSASALCPGPVHTEFTDIAYRREARRQPSLEIVHVSVERVVRLGLEAVERNKPLAIPGAIMNLAMFLTRLTPMPVLRLMWRLSSRPH